MKHDGLQNHPILKQSLSVDQTTYEHLHTHFLKRKLTKHLPLLRLLIVAEMLDWVLFHRYYLPPEHLCKAYCQDQP